MKPNHRAPPAGAPATPAVGYDGAALFDAPRNTLTPEALAHDPQALHMAIPHGQGAMSPSIPPGPMPQTPKHLHDHAPLTVQSMQGIRGLHSARSVPDFHDLYDVPGLDISTAPGDPFYYDYDFQDPLSPTFYDMPLNSSQTLVLTSELSSVGSTASASSSFLGAPPPPVEGLGIAEPGWTQLSPRSRVQQNQARVTKKTSKQTLRQKRSRANLDQAASERAGNPGASSNANGTGIVDSSAAAGSSGGSSESSNDHSATLTDGTNSRADPSVNPPANLPQGNGNNRPTSPAPSTTTSSSVALSPPVPTSPRSPTRASAPRIVSASVLPGQPQTRPMPSLRHMPSTPFPTRGKAAASPAMQSPMRSALSRPAPAAPRLQAAAAATALYTPAAPPPDPSRRTSMAAAAAAAAASATQYTTPGSRTPRVSPSTIVASASGRGPQQAQGAASPTPAARMHSSSKLVSAASDSSPAKGMFSQAQTPLPLSALPKPVQTARKVPSNQSMRRSQARKTFNIIPEMSSAMNQFQVELKPQPPRKVPSMPSGRPEQGFELLQGQADMNGPNQGGPMKKAMPLPGYPVRSNSVGPPHFAPPREPLTHLNQMYYDAPSHEPWLFAGQQHQQQQPPPLPPAPPSVAVGPHYGAMTSTPRTASNQPSHMHLSGPHPTQQEPMAPRAPQFTQVRPKTVVPVSNETSRVHPQGEPPQHVWVAHPPPPRTPRRRTPRQASKQASLRQPEPNQSQHDTNTSLQQVPMASASPVPPMPHVSTAASAPAIMEQSYGPSAQLALPPATVQPNHQSSITTGGSMNQYHAPVVTAPAAQPRMIPAAMTNSSRAAQTSGSLDPSMMHAGMATHVDGFPNSNPNPKQEVPIADTSDVSARRDQLQEAAPEGEVRDETHPGSQPQAQHPESHLLSELNDGLPSDGEFAFAQSIDYSNQEFLDTLEWVPNELDAQWDFMDVLEQEL